MKRLSRLVLASCALSIVLASAVTHAEVIERVVAVVNDDAIFLSELRTKAAPYLARAMRLPTETQRMEAIQQIYTQVLGQLIDERLMEQIAEDEEITVSAAEVEDAIENVREQAGLGPTQFWQAVREQGMTEAQYRQDLRRQLLHFKVLNQRVRSRVNITEDDVRRRYDEEAARARRSSRFRAEAILVDLPEDASASEVASGRREAERIRSTIDDEASWREAFEDTDGVDLGWLSEDDLAEELSGVLLTMEVGDISEPVRGPAGFFMFRLLDREQASDAMPPYDEVRMDVYRQMLQDAMQRQETLFLEEIRRSAEIERRLEF